MGSHSLQIVFQGQCLVPISEHQGLMVELSKLLLNNCHVASMIEDGMYTYTARNIMEDSY